MMFYCLSFKAWVLKILQPGICLIIKQTNKNPLPLSTDFFYESSPTIQILGSLFNYVQ